MHARARRRGGEPAWKAAYPAGVVQPQGQHAAGEDLQ